ncbi:hypothetical protein PHYSODRAFT_301342 [Phytophthora sojae]|uniref:Uncharacterized protein n=1 Tax=Phytophthora sojae (strain P6497) TaxID=1094619 RepID=G4ZJK1_PHYSP|nr:hypothetical protein PHYSODRAFT_301342 [Phytophthora sojae]EGZ18866.1 hypothetical protein PHYSODRAFT_301342 [Phytophthora sojae]|eukprot:XP_009527924.1 hypothetical protein PHYSODRAFT_301342 [Phytophthora sojae]
MASPSCPSTAVSDVDSVVHLESWAAQTTEHWTTQVRDEWRRQKRINNSLRFRARKKNELLHLRSERERLETEQDPPRREGIASIHAELPHAFRQLALENDALRSENLRLLLKLQQSEHSLSLMAEAVCRLQLLRMAHRAYQAEFDAVAHRTRGIPAERAPSVGHVLGWTVHRAAPPECMAQDELSFTYIRLMTRMQCSLLDADNMVAHSDINPWPLVVTPPNWSQRQRHAVNTQVLQDLGDECRVMVVNIPGQKSHSTYAAISDN